MEVVDQHIELRPVAGRRVGWAEAFEALPPEALAMTEEDEAFLSFDLSE